MTTQARNAVVAAAIGVLSLGSLTIGSAGPSALSAAASSADALTWAQSQQAACQAALDRGGMTSVQRARMTNCVADALREQAALAGASSSPSAVPTSVAPSVSPTPQPSASPSDTGGSPTPTASVTPTPTGTGSPGRACPAFPAMPDASCTGVPPGTQLVACATRLATAGQTLSGCRFDGDVLVVASNVTVVNSLVMGRVETSEGTSQTGFKMIDSEIVGTNPGYNESSIGDENYSLLRVNAHGHGHGAHMALNVSIVDSYLHDWRWGQDGSTDGYHQDAVISNGGRNGLILHSTLSCVSNAPQHNSCSASVGLFADFADIDGFRIEQCYLVTDGAYGGYGGNSAGKPHVGRNVAYVNNVFQEFAPHPAYAAIGDYTGTAGWVFTDNHWADGQIVTSPDQKRW